MKPDPTLLIALALIVSTSMVVGAWILTNCHMPRALWLVWPLLMSIVCVLNLLLRSRPIEPVRPAPRVREED